MNRLNFGQKIISAFILAMLTTAPTLAADRGIFIETLKDAINELNTLVFAQITIGDISVNWIVVALMLPMVFLTFYFAFINLRSFKIAWKVGRGDYYDAKAPGEVTQLQALSTALSGTVGLGNITGVAMAIYLGGPGATFWMILIGLFAMSLKFAESTLGVKYRTIHEDGTVSGGPMYYLEAGLAGRGSSMAKFGKILAWTYGLLAIMGLLQIAQVNQSYNLINYVAGFEGTTPAWIYGILLAILTAFTIVGGIKSIAGVTEKLVPIMCGLYIVAALFIILGHITEVPAALTTIITGAFTPDGVLGGAVGVLIIGMKRAVYSTEAGLGSSTMAHAAAKTNEPVSEGMVALMEPFIDTVVVSTMTALVIVITGAYMMEGDSVNAIQMTAVAFGSKISWFPYVLAIAGILFAFSTIISWGYYSSKIWGFVFGRTRRSTFIFQVIFCVAIIPGAVFSPKEVFDLMDALFFLMAMPNIIGIFIMAPELKRDLKSYLARLKSGEIKETTKA